MKCSYCNKDLKGKTHVIETTPAGELLMCPRCAARFDKIFPRRTVRPNQ